MNKLLQQQIEAVFGSQEVVPEKVGHLLRLVSETYDHYDSDLQRVSGALDLRPQDMMGLYLKLSKEVEHYKKVLREMSEDVALRKEAEERLEQRNQELMKINAELDRFVYNASHELRAPLASILGLITVARLRENDVQKLKLMELMQASVEKLDLFIKDIVHYARNSRMEVEAQVIDFDEMIKDSIAQLRFMGGMERITVSIDIQGEVEFRSDKKRLAVVLNNLVSNAIKYHNPSAEHPFVDIRIMLTEEEATFEIRDNGIGIQQAYVDKIFNMFVRATETQSGSGLGLYIVREIIEKMEGKVSVESQEGVGSTFRFQIPNLSQRRAI